LARHRRLQLRVVEHKVVREVEAAADRVLRLLRQVLPRKALVAVAVVQVVVAAEVAVTQPLRLPLPEGRTAVPH
jgi:hypothetical protein